MSKTVLDLLHSLGVEDDLMMIDDIGSCHKLNRLQLLGFKAYAIGLLDNAVMIMVSHTHMRVLFIWSFVLLYSQKIGGEIPCKSNP